MREIRGVGKYITASRWEASFFSHAWSIFIGFIVKPQARAMRPSSSYAHLPDEKGGDDRDGVRGRANTNPIYQTYPPRDSQYPSWGDRDAAEGDSTRGKTRERGDSSGHAQWAMNSLFFPAPMNSPGQYSMGEFSPGDTPLMLSPAPGEEDTPERKERLARRIAAHRERGGKKKKKKKKKTKRERGNKGMSTTHAALNFGKCCLGVGCFALPNAYASVGIIWAVAGTLLLSSLAAYTVCILAWTELEVINRDELAREAHYAAEDAADAEDDERALRANTAPANAGAGTDAHLAAQSFPGAAPAGGGGGGGGGAHRRRLSRRNKRRLMPKLTYPELGKKACPKALCCGGINYVLVVIYATLLVTALGVCAAYMGFMSEALQGIIPLSKDEIVVYILFPCAALLSLLRSFKYVFV